MIHYRNILEFTAVKIIYNTCPPPLKKKKTGNWLFVIILNPTLYTTSWINKQFSISNTWETIWVSGFWTLLLGHSPSNYLTTNTVRGETFLSYQCKYYKYLFIYRYIFDTWSSTSIGGCSPARLMEEQQRWQSRKTVVVPTQSSFAF